MRTPLKPVQVYRSQDDQLANQAKHSEATRADDQACLIAPDSSKVQLKRALALSDRGQHQKSFPLFQALYNKGIRNEQVIMGLADCRRCLEENVIFACVDLKVTKENKVKILEVALGENSKFKGHEALTGECITEALKRTLLASELNSELEVHDSNPLILHYFANNKMLTHDAFLRGGLEDLRPPALAFECRYTSTLSDEIRNAFPDTQIFVLKTPDQSKGQGVRLVKRDDLDSNLKLLLDNDGSYEDEYTMAQLERALREGEARFDYEAVDDDIRRAKIWKKSKRNRFIVETYVENKIIGEHEPTMRAVFVISQAQQEYRCIPFAAYWKNPPEIHANADFRASRISSFQEGRVGSQVVSEEDKQLVFDVLRENMPILFATMFRSRLSSIINQLVDHSKLKKVFKIKFYSKLARFSYLNNHFDLAKLFLSRLKKIVKRDFDIFQCRLLTIEYHIYKSELDIASELVDPLAVDMQNYHCNRQTLLNVAIIFFFATKYDAAELFFAKAEESGGKLPEHYNDLRGYMDVRSSQNSSPHFFSEKGEATKLEDAPKLMTRARHKVSNTDGFEIYPAHQAEPVNKNETHFSIN